MKLKYWIVLILAVFATSAGILYYANQPPVDLGPVMIHHVQPQSPATTTPQTDLKGWKVYANTQYGFEFQYQSNFCLGNNSGQFQQYSVVMSSKCPNDDFSFPPNIGESELAFTIPQSINKDALGGFIADYYKGANFTQKKLTYQNLQIFEAHETSNSNAGEYIDSCPATYFFLYDVNTSKLVILDPHCGIGDSMLQPVLTTFKFTK